MPETITDTYGPAMAITEPAEAEAYFAQLVQRHMERHAVGVVEAERVIRTNLGYYAGYYSRETRERVERLFLTQHPILGPVAVERAPEDCVRAGWDLARGRSGG